MIKYLVFIILFSLQGYAQTSEEEDNARERILNQYGNKDDYEKKVQETRLEDNSIQENQVDSDSNLETNSQDIDPELLKAVTESLPADMKVDENFLTKFMDAEMKSAAMQMIKKNPFASMSRHELKSFFLERTQGTKIGAQLEKNPRIMRVLVEVFHHKKAIPDLVSMINKPQKLKYYGYFFIGIMIMAFLINMKNSKGGMAKRIMLKLIIMLTTPVLNFGVFYYLFQDELGSTIEAIKYAW